MKPWQKQHLKRIIARKVMDELKCKQSNVCQRGLSAAPCHKPATQFHHVTGRKLCDECAKAEKPLYMRPLVAGVHPVQDAENTSESA